MDGTASVSSERAYTAQERAKPASDASGIGSKLDLLDAVLNELHDAVSRLAGRIEPFVVPHEGLALESPRGVNPGPTSVMHDRIDALIGQATVAIRRIGTLTDHVDA